jgi:hypothetical protein
MPATSRAVVTSFIKLVISAHDRNQVVKLALLVARDFVNTIESKRNLGGCDRD